MRVLGGGGGGGGVGVKLKISTMPDEVAAPDEAFQAGWLEK